MTSRDGNNKRWRFSHHFNCSLTHCWKRKRSEHDMHAHTHIKHTHDGDISASHTGCLFSFIRFCTCEHISFCHRSRSSWTHIQQPKLLNGKNLSEIKMKNLDRERRIHLLCVHRDETNMVRCTHWIAFNCFQNEKSIRNAPNGLVPQIVGIWIGVCPFSGSTRRGKKWWFQHKNGHDHRWHQTKL